MNAQDQDLGKGELEKEKVDLVLLKEETSK